MSEFVTPQAAAQSCPPYHPHYVKAVLSSRAAYERNAAQADRNSWLIPAITFTTDGDTRRSMALNGMRMATEYFAHHSSRILSFVEARLAAGQSDVVHDVLVYLWEQVLLMRANARQARELQAQSVAAYLGVDVARVNAFFQATPLSVTQIASRLAAGEAGPVLRQVDICALLENLLARLAPELEEWAHHESRVQHLMDEIVLRLYVHSYA